MRARFLLSLLLIFSPIAWLGAWPDARSDTLSCLHNDLRIPDSQMHRLQTLPQQAEAMGQMVSALAVWQQNADLQMAGHGDSVSERAFSTLVRSLDAGVRLQLARRQELLESVFTHAVFSVALQRPDASRLLERTCHAIAEIQRLQQSAQAGASFRAQLALTSLFVGGGIAGYLAAPSIAASEVASVVGGTAGFHGLAGLGLMHVQPRPTVIRRNVVDPMDRHPAFALGQLAEMTQAWIQAYRRRREHGEGGFPPMSGNLMGALIELDGAVQSPVLRASAKRHMRREWHTAVDFWLGSLNAEETPHARLRNLVHRVRDDYLPFYYRDQPSVLGIFEGRETNCTGRAFTLLSAVMATGQDPGNLAFDAYKDHIQLVERVADSQGDHVDLVDLLTGHSYRRSGNLYHPMAALIALLQQHGLHLGLRPSDLMIDGPRVSDDEEATVTGFHQPSELEDLLPGRGRFSHEPIGERRVESFHAVQRPVGRHIEIIPLTAERILRASLGAEVFGYGMEAGNFAASLEMGFSDAATEIRLIEFLDQRFGDRIARCEPHLMDSIRDPLSILRLPLGMSRRVRSLAMGLRNHPRYREVFSAAEHFFEQLESGARDIEILRILNQAQEPQNIEAFCEVARQTRHFGFCSELARSINTRAVRVVQFTQIAMDRAGTSESGGEQTTRSRHITTSMPRLPNAVLEISPSVLIFVLAENGGNQAFFETYSSAWEQALDSNQPTLSRFAGVERTARQRLSQLCGDWLETCLRHLQNSSLQIYRYIDPRSLPPTGSCTEAGEPEGVGGDSSSPVVRQNRRQQCLIAQQVGAAIQARALQTH